MLDSRLLEKHEVRVKPAGWIGEGFLEFFLSGKLEEDLAEMIVSGLAPMTAAGFLKQVSESLVKDVRDHVIGVDRLRVVVSPAGDRQLEPVAFFASNVREVSPSARVRGKLFHFGGGIVSQEFLRKGIGPRVAADELRLSEADFIAGHTQNLHALKLCESLAEYDFALARMLASDIGTPNPIEQRVHEGRYYVHAGRYSNGGGGNQSLYGDLAEFQARGMQIKDLDTSAGDAVLFAGRVRQAAST